MAYERCVRKKMRSLFEYLDSDRDGRITQQCLLSGLHKLQSLDNSEMSLLDATVPIDVDPSDAMCEYEIEELIRCVPAADDQGGITLNSFLEAEETVLPKLTKLKLLQ